MLHFFITVITSEQQHACPMPRDSRVQLTKIVIFSVNRENSNLLQNFTFPKPITPVSAAENSASILQTYCFKKSSVSSCMCMPRHCIIATVSCKEGVLVCRNILCRRNVWCQQPWICVDATKTMEMFNTNLFRKSNHAFIYRLLISS